MSNIVVINGIHYVEEYGVLRPIYHPVIQTNGRMLVRQGDTIIPMHCGGIVVKSTKRYNNEHLMAGGIPVYPSNPAYQQNNHMHEQNVHPIYGPSILR